MKPGLEALRGNIVFSLARLSDYAELAKPRITLMVLVTTLVGFYLGTRGSFDILLLLHVLLGTALVAGGASALNMVLECDLDTRMQRTKDRPLPAGRLHIIEGICFGTAISVTGILYLFVASNALSSLLASISLIMYLFVYTPLKRRTPLCTVVGAVPGAIPPLIGWAAARNRIDPEALVLFAVLFLWQLPHFLAIAWLYREDYARGGLPMLPVVDLKGASRQIVLNCLALLLVSLWPTMFGLSGIIYFFGALALGLAFMAIGLCLAVLKTSLYARWLLLASVIYLPLLMVLMMADKVSV